MANVAQPARLRIPEYLLDDEHFKEEYGVNSTTTPSIEKVFAMLNELGPLNYDQLKRTINRSTPVDRVLISMGLGALIADGFLMVHCEKPEVLHDIGSALLGYAGALSAGDRIRKHSQSLVEQSVAKKWDVLRKELAATQRDVEAEMVLLQDRDFAHLVSIGGWVRAFEIATRTVANNYSEETSRQLTRNEIAKYYIQGLGELKPNLQKDVTIQAVRKGLADLLPLIDGTEGKALTLEQVKVLSEKAAELSRIVTKA